ncbi:MAG: anthranilate 1,2-dioxygenase small subunit [Pseudomonas putida]
MSAELQYRVEQFLYKKSELCDAQEWDAYLTLFSEESEFHLPQWDSEHVFTQDPKREMSLIYYPNRGGLEDRVFRLRTGKAASATPMPRTLHMISNVRIKALGGGVLEVLTNWHTLYYRHATSEQFYGRATYTLQPNSDSWLISRKHTVLLNDTINSVLDFYHL